MPQRNSEFQLGLPFDVDLVLLDGYFQNPFERHFCDELRAQQTDAIFLDCELLEVPALEFHHDGHFIRAADGDAELQILEFPERFGERIDPHAEAPFFEAVAQLMEIEHAPVRSEEHTSEL